MLTPVGENIWIADGPSVPLLGLPVPVRMTAARLPDGGWMQSPIGAEPGPVAEEPTAGAPERIVIAHGAWIPRDGTAEPRRRLAWAGA